MDVAALGNAFAGANPFRKGIPFEDGDVIEVLGQYLRRGQHFFNLCRRDHFRCAGADYDLTYLTENAKVRVC